jgi:hypothetical protein
MKYMISWNERPQGSPMEYENAQKRILEVFSPWKAPANFKIESFVIRVGDWGGYMLMDCDDPLEVHKFCSMLPAFEFQARPVVPVADAIRVELEAMAWRDSSKTSDPVGRRRVRGMRVTRQPGGIRPRRSLLTVATAARPDAAASTISPRAPLLVSMT